MNLVAKEYVAAQDAENPGVLVLSRFAGAAENMPEALQVNPLDPVGVASAIHNALEMPIEERRERHAAMYRRLETQNVGVWARAFLEALEDPDATRAEPQPEPDLRSRTQYSTSSAGSSRSHRASTRSELASRAL